IFVEGGVADEGARDDVGARAGTIIGARQIGVAGGVQRDCVAGSINAVDRVVVPVDCNRRTRAATVVRPFAPVAALHRVLLFRYVRSLGVVRRMPVHDGHTLGDLRGLDIVGVFTAIDQRHRAAADGRDNVVVAAGGVGATVDVANEQMFTDFYAKA